MNNRNNVFFKPMPEHKRKEIKDSDANSNYDLNKVLEDAEKEAIGNAMKLVKNNKAKAAKILNIPRSTLYFKLKKYGMEDM